MLARISNTPRDYAWGSTSLIAGLQGRASTERPEAELWLGDHPGSPSRVDDGTGRLLPEWLAAEEPAHPALPYLLKLLAAAEPLSIQAHPSKAQAVRGFARENELGLGLTNDARNYKDDNHKPELIVALSDRFDALAGFRDLAETRALLALLGDGPGIRRLRGHLEAQDAASGIRDALRWLLSGDAGGAVDEIVGAVGQATSERFRLELDVLKRIAEARPGDPGVAVALLMNVVSLRRGEALYVRAGVIHAYLDGLGVELMAASDNVLRGGLTPKRVDVDELLSVLDTTPAAPPLLEPVRAGGVDRFVPDVPDFVLTRVGVEAGPARSLPTRGPVIALAVAGTVSVRGRSAADEVTLAPGQALVATSDETTLIVSGEGEIVLAEPGGPHA